MARSRMVRTALMAGILFVLVGCGSTETASTATGDDLTGGAALGSATATVNATDSLTFDAASVTVHPNEIVQWKNPGTMPHNITFTSHDAADDMAFGVGQTWQVKFAKVGSYPYKCTLHPGMEGTVTVTG